MYLDFFFILILFVYFLNTYMNLYVHYFTIVFMLFIILLMLCTNYVFTYDFNFI